ncbi:MAG: DNA recombination protein RmuC [Pseudomonadota bacterium]
MIDLRALLDSPQFWPALLLILALGIGLGILIEWLFARRAAVRQTIDIARLEEKIQLQDQVAEEREQLMNLVESQLSGTFGDLARKTMQSNSETFLKLAEQNLKAQHEKADHLLAQREKSVEGLVKPIEAALKRSETQIAALEKARSEAYGGITEQLLNMQKMTTNLQSETRNLITALRRPEVRGQWGEITLRRLVEMAGMVEHCDFVEQDTVRDEEGKALRPDLIVRMPDQRELVVDVKTPLDAYLSAVEAADDATRTEHLKRHERKVRERINELAKKSYWSQFKNSPEFVILFIPGDQFLTAALNENPSLIDDALRQNIILATPTSFVALLKAVAYGWNQLALAENAEQIRTLAIDLHSRLGAFTGHLAKIGRQLDGSVKAYNQAVGSMERNVLPGARKFVELGIPAKKALDDIPALETRPRESTTANNDKDTEE